MNNEFDDIFSNNTSDEQIEVLDIEENPPILEKTKKKFELNLDLKNDKVLLIQLILLGVWLLLTLIVYFFGYNLFSPFINV